ncbi:MAG TPA: hypothetical protein VIG39_10625 [Rhizomicrobium sp.]
MALWGRHWFVTKPKGNDEHPGDRTTNRMKSAARRAQPLQHMAYPDEELRPAKPDEAAYPRAVRQRTDAAQPARVHQKWSPRQSLMFIVGVSALLWAAIIWACIHYL